MVAKSPDINSRAWRVSNNATSPLPTHLGLTATGYCGCLFPRPSVWITGIYSSITSRLVPAAVKLSVATHSPSPLSGQVVPPSTLRSAKILTFPLADVGAVTVISKNPPIYLIVVLSCVVPVLKPALATVAVCASTSAVPDASSVSDPSVPYFQRWGWSSVP